MKSPSVKKRSLIDSNSTPERKCNRLKMMSFYKWIISRTNSSCHRPLTAHPRTHRRMKRRTSTPMPQRSSTSISIGRKYVRVDTFSKLASSIQIFPSFWQSCQHFDNLLCPEALIFRIFVCTCHTAASFSRLIDKAFKIWLLSLLCFHDLRAQNKESLLSTFY